MQRVQAVKPTFTVEDIYTRAKETLENCIKQGTTRIRTHAEVDPPVGIKGVEALQVLAKEYAWAVDLEICVFPQEGLTTSPNADAALVEGLKRGANAIGAAPNYDTDHPGQIHRIFGLARQFDVDIDMHIDSGDDPSSLDLHLVAELTEKYKLGGGVAMGHAPKVPRWWPTRTYSSNRGAIARSRPTMSSTPSHPLVTALYPHGQPARQHSPGRPE